MAPDLGTAYYAQWETGKLSFAGEYWRTPVNPTLTIAETTVYVPLDTRSWYVMGSFHLTRKLDVGSYYSHYLNKAADTALPENYSKDFVSRHATTSTHIFTQSWKAIFCMEPDSATTRTLILTV